MADEIEIVFGRVDGLSEDESMTQKQPSKLSPKNFFIYNVNYGQTEGQEEEKILFFHPRDTNIDVKMREVGLSEAIVKFAENFDSAECDAVHTQKTRKLFLQPEESFWMIMTLNVPYGPRSTDVLEGNDYLGGDVESSVYQAVLKQAYSTARLFIGPFQSVLDAHNGDTAVLKKKLDDFFKRYLLDLRVGDCDILNVFDGVQFLPLDRTTFLRSQCFVNLVEATFPIVSHSLLIYDSNLVWSGLNPEDVKVVYRYVCNSLLPKHLKANYLAKLSHGGSNPRLTRFVTGPECLIDTVYSDKTPKVYLDKIQRPGFFHLIVYKIHDLVICLFVRSKEPLRLELYRQLDAFLYDRMSELITEIKSYKKSVPEQPEAPDTRYVYFNSMNLATKDSLRERKGNPSSDALVRALVRLHNHNVNLSKEGCLSSETFMRMATDHWVIGRMSNFRQFYIAIERKKLTLQEVDDVAKRICENKLKGIFFHV